jgi:hypothetical protein
LLEGLATRAARQPQAQQVHGVGDAAHPLDRQGVAGQLVEIQIGRQTRQDVQPIGVRGR